MAAPTLAEPLPKVKFTLDWRFEGPSAPDWRLKTNGGKRAGG
jgi:NitT/TauT family transport system substrate-binding protein